MDSEGWFAVHGWKYLVKWHHSGSYQLYPELTGADLKDCVSNNSLSSNASLPSVQSCRRLRERRVASWAVSFERLLQDPV
ncbi:regulator of G protein signaling 12, partial [Homo sapiens]